MERKGLVSGKILICMLIMLSGCSETAIDDRTATVRIDLGEHQFLTKSMNPDEDRISNVSIIVFDRYGVVEEERWYPDYSPGDCCLELLAGKEYRITACVNFGYKVHFSGFEELENHRFHLAYPDEYTEGIPMIADTGLISIKKDCSLTLQLIRLMSKISLRIDRRLLSKDVELKVRSVKVGNCPKSVKTFGRSRVEDIDDCFPMGFYRDDEECAPLNEMSEKGVSKEVSLYMLENLQGRFNGTSISDDEEKVFDEDDPKKDICSYVELGMDYVSRDWKSTEQKLVYRFYIGEDKNSLDIERNCHYKITVCPEDDGLKGDGWRVDKEGLVPIEPISFSSFPDSYIRGDIGDRIHIGCTFTPSYAPFDVGLEYMMDDRKEGIYDFEIDDDGRGATLTLTGPGRGLIYMEAGEPVNESALWIVEVNLPPGS